MKERTIPLLPLVLTAAIIAVDQATKAIIVRTIPLNTRGLSALNDFLRIIHVRNLGVAFSLGNGLPESVRRIVFIIVPGLVMIGVLIYYVRAKELTMGMRWALAGILGGGLGNLVDRIFRPLGVVDFVHVRVYGFLGMERWPVFNVSDSSIVVSGILLVILFVVQEQNVRKESIRE